MFFTKIFTGRVIKMMVLLIQFYGKVMVDRKILTIYMLKTENTTGNIHNIKETTTPIFKAKNSQKLMLIVIYSQMDSLFGRFRIIMVIQPRIMVMMKITEIHDRASELFKHLQMFVNIGMEIGSLIVVQLELKTEIILMVKTILKELIHD
jgi:hypothetical protein